MALASGMNDHVAKPIDMNVLLPTIMAQSPFDWKTVLPAKCVRQNPVHLAAESYNSNGNRGCGQNACFRLAPLQNVRNNFFPFHL